MPALTFAVLLLFIYISRVTSHNAITFKRDGIIVLVYKSQ